MLDFSNYRKKEVADLLEDRKNLAAVASGVGYWRKLKSTEKSIVLGTAALAAIGQQVIAQSQPNELGRLRVG